LEAQFNLFGWPFSAIEGRVEEGGDNYRLLWQIAFKPQQEVFRPITTQNNNYLNMHKCRKWDRFRSRMSFL
jgi:hypothetical protein